MNEPRSRMTGMAPVYVAEACRTAGGGLTSIAVINFMLLERGFSPEVTGSVAAVFNLGFVLFTLVAGNCFERFGRRRVLVVLSVITFLASTVYVLPLDSLPVFVLFVIARFIDGGSTGVFWSTVQSYAKHYAEIDEGLRNKYTSLYNLSWNTGIIGGTLLGWVLAVITSTNVVAFYFSIAIAFIQLGVILFLKDVDGHAGEPRHSNTGTTVRVLSADEVRTVNVLPYQIVFVAVLVHSFTTGGFSMFVPVLVQDLSLAGHVPYLFFLVQSIAQTVSMTASGHVRERQVTRMIIAMPAVLGLSWVLLGVASLPVVVPVVVVMSVAQGVLYSSGMRFLTSVSQQQRKGRIFSYWQFTMGFGRMAGPFSFGFFLAISIPFAITFVTTFAFGVVGCLVVLAARRGRHRPTPA